MTQASPSAGVTIEYVAHACFRITSPGGTTVMVDPYESRWWLGYDFPSTLAPAEAVLLSHPHPDHDAGYAAGRAVPWDEDTTVVTDPGTYEFADITVTGIEGKHADPYGEEFGQKNTIWLIETGGLRIGHPGDNAPITDELAEALDPLHILMLPVDDLEHILTHEAVADWRFRTYARVMIPMHYRHHDLEVDEDSPSDLAGIDDWLGYQVDFGYVQNHRMTLTPDDFPLSPRIWVFDHSPEVGPPG